MNDAFKDFVHVSTRTWLALMGFANIIYCVMGIVTFATSTGTTSSHDYNQIIPVTLSWIFIGYCILFMIVSFFISVKMEVIFRSIIEKDSWIHQLDSSLITINPTKSFFGKSLIGTSWSTSTRNIATPTLESSTRSTDHGTNKSQKDQFWFRKPDLIITFAQLMQFGFSVGFAILLVYQKTVRAGNVFEWWGWYFVAPVICFLIFIWLWSVNIPLYTQCTNLGELVSKRHLIEIEAISQLQEERNRRQEHIDYALAEKDVDHNMRQRTKVQSKDRKKRVRIRSVSAVSTEGMFSNETLEQISEFVKKPTKDLPRHSKNISLNSESNDSFFISPALKEVEEDIKNASKEGNDGSENKKMSFVKKARNFFLSQSYRQGSAVFGTLIALYIFGLRIQLMLVHTCGMKDRDLIWYFTLKEPDQVFWLIIGWLCIFLVESSVIIILFGHEKDRKNFFMVLAGCFDILITCFSIGIFLLAEFNRCCDCNSSDNDNNARHLRTSNIFFASTRTYETDNETDSSLCVIADTEKSCCPSFGMRLCGGVGVLEPFTVLIVLRLLRFSAAHNIAGIESKTYDSNRENDESEDFLNQKGTIAELWIMALTQYTDIVKRHGIFSANLLESMLGIDPFPEPGSSGKDIENNSRSLAKIDAVSVNERSSIATVERPNAKLIRSMRRCAFKWFPLLNDKWQLVDIVLTEYEIIWFDVKVNLSQMDDDEKDTVIATRERIRESNGGKGFLLSEVARGRTILGRLSLSDLEQVVMQKVALHDEKLEDYNDDIEKIGQNSRLKSEYWETSQTSLVDIESSLSFDDDVEKFFDSSRCKRRLKLKTNHGTLYVQFAADKGNIRSEGQRKKKQDVTFVWCQTISHELNQERFNSKDDGRDLIEIVHSKDLEHEKGDNQVNGISTLQRIVSGRSSRNWI